ncbi:sodium:calcium antiporter [Thioclava sp. DLFJ5-1]|uniref:calcium/sodium antiporter n=1 Tax=Thioclava TaxID=285107 RepID=UPI0009984C5B|nr:MULTISPECIES: calcium/sodium antiporter [Thioclava]MAQ37125.1 sodium:calcium antiporter [Thioclava sp.]OOY02903.1 sodium:calcium antiporter [Thioclava sp. F28-4]OOY07074.1 sodium:calcium antiporter [Thioclava sp. F36-7]OOY19402.1 sodium:calcium antiporter [Thioclava sp. DLFJ5-1]
MFEIWGPILAGLVALVVGGELMVRGAVQTAERIGISPLVIGLTLVGFGTSTPELVTSVQAGLSGSPGIAFGNVVGSNIANILLIAGVSAVIAPLVVARVALRRDAMVMLVVAVVFAGVAPFAPMGRIAGVGLIAALVGYLGFVIHQERQHADRGAIYDKTVALADADPGLAPPHAPHGILMPLLLAFAGLGLVVFGGSLLVGGAVSLARAFGVSETVIGLTIVAIGTSMPELITSIVAALKRQGEVAFGNVVGSNIYNILGIGGTTALIAPSRVPEEIARFDAPLMVLVSLLLVVFATTGLRITRWEGLALIAGYGIYLWKLWP